MNTEIDRASKPRSYPLPLRGHQAPSPSKALRTIILIAGLAWSFTESNFLTYIIPNCIFGVIGAFAASVLTEGPRPSILEILQRLPIIVAFNWLNTLTFDLSNQRSPESIQEDSLNKPWRPIPSGKVTADQARWAMLICIPATLAVNCLLGLWMQGLCILILNWIYNDLKGGDKVIRNPLISIAYGLSHTCSLKLAVGVETEISQKGIAWTAMLSGVILTTMHVQDSKDKEGDRARGRQTMVLLLGDTISRSSIAFFICCWSIICAYVWGLDMWFYMVPLVPGLIVAFRVLLKRTAREDYLTWICWCFWTVALYLLPLLSLLHIE
ncbi:UbiA prenyltransferase family-domain-containing protein [Hypoxylon crocopeplum]|nr:UbiA prenyltransferase family-domain-containing protein [Hypoxylon crocopeplum]